MSMTMLDNLKMQFAETLQRKASTVCSRWAENYVILGKPVPGPLRFNHHPWSRAWHDCNENWKGKKAAQMAMTASALNRAIFTVDILRNDVLYLFPSLKDASDFSKSKFDGIIAHSAHISSLFSNVRNVGHKQSGGVNLYLRGTRSRSSLKTISTGLMIYDEYDEMKVDNLKLAEQRKAGYQSKDIQEIMLSTPTIPEYGITKVFESTNQQHYFFKCPLCSRSTEFVDLSCFVICTDSPNDIAGLNRSYLICPECKKPLPHDDDPQLNIKAKQSYINEDNCFWKPTLPGNSEIGFWIPSFYSTVRPIANIAKLAIEARTDEIANTELHNSVLAREYVQEGARVTVQQVEACRDNFQNHAPSSGSKIITMGVDVGHKVLYYHIDEWLFDPRMLGPNINANAVPRTLSIGIVPDFARLESLLYSFQILHTVIDVDPETREAIELAQKYPKQINLCRFVKGVRLKNIQNETADGLIVQVNRTIWLDISQSRYRRARRGIILPVNLPQEYAKHISALIKVQKKDDEGNLLSRYISIGDDHYAFAKLYSEIALPHAVSLSENRDIASFL